LKCKQRDANHCAVCSGRRHGSGPQLPHERRDAVIRDYLDDLDARRFAFRPGLGCSMCDFGADLSRGRFVSPRSRHVGWCARAFLRFLLQDGLLRRDLAAAVPTVARWRLAPLPTTLRKEETTRLVGAADLRKALGRRDYAIIMCLSESSRR
jgi:integrase